MIAQMQSQSPYWTSKLKQCFTTAVVKLVQHHAYDDLSNLAVELGQFQLDLKKQPYCVWGVSDSVIVHQK